LALLANWAKITRPYREKGLWNIEKLPRRKGSLLFNDYSRSRGEGGDNLKTSPSSATEQGSRENHAGYLSFPEGYVALPHREALENILQRLPDRFGPESHGEIPDQTVLALKASPPGSTQPHTSFVFDTIAAITKALSGPDEDWEQAETLVLDQLPEALFTYSTVTRDELLTEIRRRPIPWPAVQKILQTLQMRHNAMTQARKSGYLQALNEWIPPKLTDFWAYRILDAVPDDKPTDDTVYTVQWNYRSLVGITYRGRY
jgi:hypothetical protein